MRDVFTALLMADIVEGVPVSYATFVGYDEVAHHSGIREPDALAVLKRHDDQLARLERAIAQAPRPYHLVVLSDHGQTQGRPFRQRFGETLEEVVHGALAQGGVLLAGGGRRGVGRRRRGARRRAPGAERGRPHARARRRAAGRSKGPSRWGPTARRSSEHRDSSQTPQDEAVVHGLGRARARSTCRRARERLTIEQITEAHPGCSRRSPAIPGSAS